MRKLWIIFIAMLVLVVFTVATAFAQDPPFQACAQTHEHAPKVAIEKSGCKPD